MTRKYLAIFAAVAALATGCATKKTPAPQLGGVTRAANAAGDAVAGATASSEEVRKFHGSSTQLVDRLDAQVQTLLKK
jgi:hypothetical protein